jgi:hypothetical protein
MDLRICPSALRGTCKSEYCPHKALHKEVESFTTWEKCNYEGKMSYGCPACKYLKDLPKKTRLKLIVKEY